MTQTEKQLANIERIMRHKRLSPGRKVELGFMRLMLQRKINIDRLEVK